MMSRAQSARWALATGALALCVTGALGCHRISLFSTQDPTASQPFPPMPPGLFDIEWHTRLVKPTQLEYEPREAAGPAHDPASGIVVAATRDTKIRGVSPKGEVLWTVPTGNGASASPTIHEGTAFIPGGDGMLYALDVKTGKQRWKADLSEELATTPVWWDGRLIVASHSGTVFSVNGNDGQRQWQYRRDLPTGFNVRGVSKPLVHENVVYLGFADGFVAALNPADGTANWERNVSGDATEFLDVDSSPFIEDGGRLVVTSYRAGVIGLDRATGNELWRNPTKGLTGLTGKGSMLFATGDGVVMAIQAQNGRTVWTLPLKNLAGGAPVLADGHLVVPVTASLLFVDPTTGKTSLAWDPGRGVNATVRSEGSRLYVLSNNGFLYSLLLEGAH